MNRLLSSEWKDLERTLARRDPDRYVSAFFVPERNRRGFMALCAFDNEVSGIARTISEPMMGQIRLAWWREQIDAIYGGRHIQAPAAQALAEAVDKHHLPQEKLDAYIDARGCDFDEAPFADEDAFNTYSDAAFGGIIALSFSILGVAQGCDAAAMAAGRAVARAVTLREFAHRRERRLCRVPVEWLQSAGLSANAMFAKDIQPMSMAPIFDRFKDAIRQDLVKLNSMGTPRKATPALAFASCARWEARRKSDAWHPQPMPEWQRLIRIALANLARRF